MSRRDQLRDAADVAPADLQNLQRSNALKHDAHAFDQSQALGAEAVRRVI